MLTNYSLSIGTTIKYVRVNHGYTQAMQQINLVLNWTYSVHDGVVEQVVCGFGGATY